MEEEDGVYMPAALLSREDTVKDPWMHENLLEKVNEHRGDWTRRKLPVFEHVARILAQMRALGEFFGVQQHMFHTAQLMLEHQERQRAFDERRGGRDEEETPEVKRHKKLAIGKMRANIARARAAALGTEVDPLDDEEEEAEEEEKEEGKAPREGGIEEVDEPKEGRLVPELAELAKKWMVPLSFRVDPAEVKRVRVMFFSLFMYADDVKHGSLFHEKSVPAEIAQHLEAAGVKASEMAAMTYIPFTPAKQWGAYNNVPATMMKFFMPYAREIMLTLRPQYVVVFTKPSSLILQQELNPDKSRPDVVTENMLTKVKVVQGFSPDFIRFLHPMQVKDGGPMAEEREAALKRFCAQVSPVKPIRNPFDIMMGRQTSAPEAAGALVWALCGRVGIMAFPREEDVAPVLRQRVGYVLNLTNRKLPGSVKRHFEFVEAQVEPRASMSEMHGRFEEMEAQIDERKKAVICCGTGVRESMKVLAMFLCRLQPDFPVERVVHVVQAARGARMPIEDVRAVQDFHEFTQGFQPDAMHYSVVAGAEQTVFTHCATQFRANATAEVLRDHAGAADASVVPFEEVAKRKPQAENVEGRLTNKRAKKAD